MTRNGPRRSRARRGLLAAVVAVTLGVGAILSGTPALTAEAAESAASTEREVTDGSLSWGIRAEWRNYIGLGPGTAGPGATGEMLVDGSASINDSNITTWSEGTGTVDLENGSGTVSYSGTLTYRGHPGSWYPGGWGMTQTYSDPQIELTSPTTATLSMEMTQSSVIQTWPTVEEPTRYDLVNLTFSATDLADGVVKSTSATLTEDGAWLWNNYGAYIPGVEMDQITFSFDAEPLPEPSVQTTTLLSGGPATVLTGEQVELSTTVTPAVAGTVTFKNNGAVVDTVTTKDGTASLRTDELAVGQHMFTAEFLPSDSGYLRSTSNSVSIAVDQPADSTAVQGSLQWGVKQSFREYLVGSIAHGSITPSDGASQASHNGVFTFPQASSGTTWNGSTGTIQFAGLVNFYGHDGVLDVNLANPVIEVTSSSSARLKVPFGADNELIVLAEIDLSSGNRQDLDGDAVRFSNARVTLAQTGEQYFSDPTGQGSDQPFYTAGTELDRITFTIGAGSEVGLVDPPVTTPKARAQDETPAPATTASGSGTASGSLKWGVSSYFVQYTTQRSGSSCPTPSQHCAGGSIATSGVGDGWLFPQATGGSWDSATQTGTVQFSGVVTFNGYGLTMFQVANPVIRVTSATSATLYTGYSGSYGPSSVGLDLGAATKTVGENGEVTWSDVPVQGGLVGISASQSIAFDPLTFTVGTPSSVSYGSTEQGEDEATTYTAAATPPTTEGLTVLTPADRIVEGGRIEVSATGFEPNDAGVLVVLYEGTGESGPIVLDDEATADETGQVSWSGTLPEDGTGEHILTLQGSTAAGAQIDILERETDEAADLAAIAPEAQGSGNGPASDILPGGMALWEWWVAAGGLVAIAACTSTLAIRQQSRLAP